MEQNCLNCHYFAKKLLQDGGGYRAVTVDSRERELFQTNPNSIIKDWIELLCHRGVWDQRRSKITEREVLRLIAKNRENNCPFYTYSESAPLQVIEELQDVILENNHLHAALTHLRNRLHISFAVTAALAIVAATLWLIK